MLGMVNKGPHTNASQFYVTLKTTPWMDTKYVAFGRLIDGYSTLKKIEELQSENERPIKENSCIISSCGVVSPQEIDSVLNS
jgi:peptidyl-prolyl cis-trans isomerase-like 6